MRKHYPHIVVVLGVLLVLASGIFESLKRRYVHAVVTHTRADAGADHHQHDCKGFLTT